jgi:hypothetical protein
MKYMPEVKIKIKVSSAVEAVTIKVFNLISVIWVVSVISILVSAYVSISVFYSVLQVQDSWGV